MTGRSKVVVAAIGLAAAMFALVAQVRGLDEDRSASSSDFGGIGSSDLVQQFDVPDRQQVQAFDVSLLDGSRLSSNDLVGRPTVVNVWGSWCGPCREEAPDLVRVAREFGEEVQFVGLNVRDNPDAARAFERSFNIPYPSVHPDDSPGAILAFGGALTSAAVPTTVVVDSQGGVAARVVGQVDASTLRNLIDDVLAEQRAKSTQVG